MSATVTALKTVSGQSPYIGDTFQELAQKIVGRDGYLAGGAITDSGSDVIIGPVVFIQNGLVVETQVDSAAIAYLGSAEPWFIVASTPDDDPVTGTVFSLTADLVSAASGTIIAFKVNGTWQNPRGVGVVGASQGAPEVGIEDGFEHRLGVDGSGDLNQLDLEVGRLVDPDDVRRDLVPEVGESAKAASVMPFLAHEEYTREDHVVLRQRESYSPELMVLRGATYPAGVTFNPSLLIAASIGGYRGHYYGRPNGTLGQQWWAWPDGTDLYIKGGPAGEAFGATVLVSVGGAKSYPWIVGQRASDDAVVVLYLDGTSALNLVSFNAATGAVVDGPVTIDNQANTIVRPMGVLDAQETMHFVFEHDELTSPSQQIYYGKVGIVSATFGTEALAPRIVDGPTSTGKNDTWPTVAVDRHGVAHVAYITGTGTNEYGDFVYAVIDPTGITESVSTHLVASSASEDDGSSGFVTKACDDFRRPAIVVTPHDEVYAALLATTTATGNVDAILLFSPGFQERLGYPLIEVTQPPGPDNNCIAMTATDQGALAILAIGGVTPFLEGDIIVLDSVIAPNGRLGDTVRYTNSFLPPSPGVETFPSVSIGPVGEVVTSRTQSGNFTAVRENLLQTSYFKITPHPKDVYLKTYMVLGAAGGAGEIPVEDGDVGSAFEIFNTRPKKMNYPILVGDKGDYQGFAGLIEAQIAARRIGGEIILRPGRHVIKWPITLYGGMRLRGEGMAYIDADVLPVASNSAVRVGSSILSAAVTLTGNLLESPTSFYGIKPGDQMIGGSGYHTVLKVFDSTPTFPTRVLLDNMSDGTAPTGVNWYWLPAGIVVENLIINAGTTGATSVDVIHMYSSYMARISNIKFMGEHTNVTTPNVGALIAFEERNYMPLVDNIDLMEFEAPEDHYSIGFYGSSSGAWTPTVRNVRMKDGGPKIFIGAGCYSPMLSHIHGDYSDPSKELIYFESGRTDPAYINNCHGRLSGFGGDYLVTGVGRKIRQPQLTNADDDESIGFEDGCTRQGTIGDDMIKLANTSHTEFNGTTADVITQAVNERVQKAGDAMSGNLTTDGTTRNLGAAGAAGNRFNVYANTLDVLGAATHAANILTDGTTRNLGATGAATNAFNVYANTLNVMAGASFQAEIWSNFVPNMVGNDLGSATLRWDAFLEIVKVYNDLTAYKDVFFDTSADSPGYNLAFGVKVPDNNFAAVAKFYGRGGNPGGSATTGGAVVDGYGQLQPGTNFLSFQDDFICNNIDTNVWNAAGTGVESIENPHIFRMTVDAGESHSANTWTDVWGTRQDLGLVVRVRGRISTTSSTLEAFWALGSIMFGWNNGEVASNWHFAYRDDLNVWNYIDTGVAVSTAFKYFVFATNGDDHFFWSIDTSDVTFDGSGGGRGEVTLPGVRTFDPTPVSKTFNFGCSNNAGAAGLYQDTDLIDVRGCRL
jgi:hypothetical protein